MKRYVISEVVAYIGNPAMGKYSFMTSCSSEYIIIIYDFLVGENGFKFLTPFFRQFKVDVLKVKGVSNTKEIGIVSVGAMTSNWR